MKKNSNLYDLYTEDSKILIEKMKKYISEELNFSDRDITNWNIYRFVRSGNFNEKKIKNKLKNWIKFKKKIKYKKISEINFNKEFSQIEKHSKFGFYKEDKKGQPIFIMRIEEMNFKKMLEKKSEEKIKNYWINFYERIINIVLPIQSQKKKKRIDKVIFILDFKNANLFPLLNGKVKSFFMNFLLINQKYYPDLTYKCFVINSGYTFKILWNIAKLLIDKITKECSVIINGNGFKEISEFIDVENIPKIFGGKSSDEIFQGFCLFRKELERSKEENYWYLRDEESESYKFFLEENERGKF